jgi:hypothetical protein
MIDATVIRRSISSRNAEALLSSPAFCKPYTMGLNLLVRKMFHYIISFISLNVHIFFKKIFENGQKRGVFLVFEESIVNLCKELRFFGNPLFTKMWYNIEKGGKIL